MGRPLARAAYPATAGLVGAVEAVEDVGDVLGVDASVPPPALSSS
jgi:hypothetical protein